MLEALNAGYLLPLLGIGLAAFLAGTCSGMTGFGGGLLLPPVLAPVIGVQNVVPVLSIAMLITNLHRFALYRKFINWRLAGAVLSTIVPATLVGAMFYLNLDSDAVSVLLGVFLLASVPVGRWFSRLRMQIRPGGLAVACGFCGLVSGTTPGIGMLLVPILLSAGLVGEAFLATDAIISVAVNLTKSVLFGQVGNIALDMLAAGILIGICTIPGNYLARWLMRRTSLRLHARLLEGVVLVGGVSLLLRPLWQAPS
jgi:uncharacterized membrane protein YfcA